MVTNGLLPISTSTNVAAEKKVLFPVFGIPHIPSEIIQ
jgi:predicted amidohydrolase